MELFVPNITYIVIMNVICMVNIFKITARILRPSTGMQTVNIMGHTWTLTEQNYILQS